MGFFIKLLAFCSPMILFIFWGIVGYTTLALIRSQRNLMQNLLLAPTMGFAVTLIPIFLLSRAGIAVEAFAVPYTIILFLATLITLYFKKPYLPWRHYLPFFLLLFVAFCLIARPLLSFGVNWVSYSNEDMANYCLGSLRFYSHGFSAYPNVNDLLLDRDYSLYYWFLHVAGMSRAGSELLIAWLMRLTHLSPFQVFMPLIVAMHLSLISAGAALVYQARRWRYAALATCFLLVFSALTTLGTLYELIAQVGGLCLLIACTLFLFQPLVFRFRSQIIKYSLLLAVSLLALVIDYPEVLPFLVLGFIFYLGISLCQGYRPSKSFYSVLGIVILIGIVVLNTYWLNLTSYTMSQFNGGLGLGDATDLQNSYHIEKLVNAWMFPYYFIPSGLANLWGFLPIAQYPTGSWLTIVIGLGAGLFLLAIISSFWLAIRYRFPAAIMCITMLLLSVYLFTSKIDFGLFKLAMYIQPFMLATVVVAFFHLVKTPVWRVLPLILLAAGNISTQNYYVERSYALTGGGLTEILYASESKIIEEFGQLIATAPTDTQLFVLDNTNIVLAKFESYYLRGKEAVFPTSDYFYDLKYSRFYLLKEFKPKLLNFIVPLREKLDNRFIPHEFILHNSQKPFVDPFAEEIFTVSNPAKTEVILNTSRQSIFNRREFEVSGEMRNFVLKPWDDVHNHVIFINSTLGQPYYVSILKSTLFSLYQLENDLFYPGKTFAAVGRYLLFHVINPTPAVRFELNMTMTFNGDNNNQLPPAAAVGTKRVLFPMMGRGSARVFSSPVTPQVIANNPYLLIDMGQDAKSFPNHRTILMRLYGTTVPIDRRHVVGFLRDISLVSEKQYEALNPPSSLSHFPDDLLNPDLEYSGLYEDGWVSEAAFFNLKQPHGKTRLKIEFSVPEINKNRLFTTLLTLSLNHTVILHQKFKPGSYTVTIPVQLATGTKHIELHFSDKQSLPKGDGRPVGAKLIFLGFT